MALTVDWGKVASFPQSTFFKNMRPKTFTCIAILIVTSAGRGGQEPALVASHAPSAIGVVARVNDVNLKNEDLARVMRQIFPYYAIHGGRVPPEKEPEIRREALDRIILEELLYQEAHRRGIQAPEAKIKARIATVRKDYASEEEFRSAVVAMSGSEAALRQKIRRAVIAETLWEQEVVKPARVTPAGVRRFYQQNPKRFTQPESVWLQTISFEVRKDAFPAERELTRQKAEEVLKQARAARTPNEFGALAGKHSTDDWRVMNGDHRWVHRGTLETALEVAFSLKPGETSGLVSSSYGFHILRVNGHRSPRLAPFPEVKESLTRSLNKQRLEERKKNFAAKLRVRAKIEIP